MSALIADFRRIRQLLELSRARLALSVTWGVLALGSGLGLAALAAWLIARAWQMPPVLDLSLAVVTVRALGISRGVCRYLERLATHDVALRSMSIARTTTYRTLASADIWRPRRTGTEESAQDRARQADPTRLRRGELLGHVMSDIDDLGAVVVRAFVPIAVAVVLSLFAVTLLAFISIPAAVILAVALAVSGIVAPYLSARAAREAELAVRADRTDFTAEALTVLDHAPELRVAGRLPEAVAAARRAGQRAVAAEDRAAARSAWSAAVLPLSVGASVLGALLIGIVLYGTGTPVPASGWQTVTGGGITPMALTVLVLIPLSAFEAVGVLPAAAQALTTGRAALHRLESLRHDDTATTVPATRETALADGVMVPAAAANMPAAGANTSVTTANTRASAGTSVSASWAYASAAAVNTRASAGTSVSAARAHVPAAAANTAGRNSRADDTPASDRMGARLRELPDLPPGRRIAVVGPSGAGKTTLLMAWAGLFGTPRPGVTFFAEDAHLFGTTVLENLRVARGDITTAEAEAALRAVGAGEWLDSLPDGVDTDLVGGAAAVSGGQRRRILLARALLSPARVLLLDEPTEHMEAAAGAELQRRLLDESDGLLAPDRVVVVVTHQLPPGHRADTVVRVAADGAVTITSLIPEKAL